MKKKLMPDSVFYEDIAMKLKNLQNQNLYKLNCAINDENSLLFILKEENEDETPYETPDTNHKDENSY